jgi:uncharacterized protein (DUF433 family)
MLKTNRITSNNNVLNGRACIRDLSLPVSLILGLLGTGMAKNDILREYPMLEEDDINQCLNYAALLSQNSLFAI